MNKDETDYSLSYDEYLENFRKTHHPQAIAMSKDQFEREKAKREAQKKREAAREAGTAEGAWSYQKGPSDEIVEKYTGEENPAHEKVLDAANEIIERRITPDQQGTQSKGNGGDDNINNPDALDTSEITKLQNELKSMAQTEENMEPGTMTFTPEQVEEAKKNAGITKNVPGSTSANNALTDSVSEAVTPKENDSPEEHNAKGKYNKSMMSIWDAYRNGDIDKETAGYFTIDAIANLAKNLGRSIGNVGAQFSGGTIDNGHDTSMWEQRRDSMFGTELQKETEGVDTFENKFKQLSYNRNSTINDLIEAVKSDADKLSDDNPLKIAYLSLAAMIASGQVDGTTTIAATGAKGITELFNLFKRKDKK